MLRQGAVGNVAPCLDRAGSNPHLRFSADGFVTASNLPASGERQTNFRRRINSTAGDHGFPPALTAIPGCGVQSVFAVLSRRLWPQVDGVTKQTDAPSPPSRVPQGRLLRRRFCRKWELHRRGSSLRSGTIEICRSADIFRTTKIRERQVAGNGCPSSVEISLR